MGRGEGGEVRGWRQEDEGMEWDKERYVDEEREVR